MPAHLNAFRRNVLIGILSMAGAAWVQARPHAAPLLLLAKEAPQGLEPAGFLVSEKLDGVRASWDGELLRFRGGGVIAAPDWFLARLPKVPLDGELWIGRGQFEAVSAAVRRLRPQDAEWRQIRYMVFELPGAPGTYAQRHARLMRLADPLLWPQLAAVEQFTLATPQALMQRLEAVVRAGGEGLMLHRADAPYTTGRSDLLLKLKPQQDAEAVVVAHWPGKGKHLGRVGALQVRTPQGVEFALGSGLTDEQRQNPPKVGQVVTFTYRGMTSQGVPRFATFLRLRGAG
jgi:DNA ligase 1